MQIILLTQGKSALVDDADYEWLNQWKWCADKSRNTFYAERYSNGTKIKMHRLLVDAPKGLQVDHRDGDGLNNQRSNLRVATHKQNIHNSDRQLGISGVVGVVRSKIPGRWNAFITDDRGKRIRLGAFDSKTQASLAYDKAAIEYRGEFAKIHNSLDEINNFSGKSTQRASYIGNSGYRGVWRNGNAWIAVINDKDRRRYLGSFPTREAAALAYNVAALDIHGNSARLNDVYDEG